ncbi:nuclear transport factor 2 family protein [Minwuia sp.]|uniref:nuclear transport factor 2 family protein n=1 Tax=Minwuia sp. TaxID=2493630 RepID=UPI003A8EE623
MTDATLTEVAERFAISDILYRYATAIDTKNFDLLNDVFDAEVETDFTSFGGRKVKVSRDEWIDTVRKTIIGLDMTQHLTGNHVHRIDGDRANLIAYLQAFHRYSGSPGETDYFIGGYYDIDLVKRPEGWRVVKYALETTWQRGNREIIREAHRAHKNRAA